MGSVCSSRAVSLREEEGVVQVRVGLVRAAHGGGWWGWGCLGLQVTACAAQTATCLLKDTCRPPPLAFSILHCAAHLSRALSCKRGRARAAAARSSQTASRVVDLIAVWVCRLSKLLACRFLGCVQGGAIQHVMPARRSGALLCESQGQPASQARAW